VIAPLLCAALVAAAASPNQAGTADPQATAAASGGRAADVPRGESMPQGPSREVAAPGGPLQLRIAFVPLASYGSNVGLQVGGALLFYKSPQAGGARRDWLALGASWATEGPRSVEVKGEQFEVRGTRLRVFYQARYGADDQAPYWGEGARLAPGDEPGAGSPPPGYRYRAVGPWISVFARHPLGEGSASPWAASARVRFKQLDVYFPGAALQAAQPPGAGGGMLTTFHAGVLRDTRDDEISPSRGTSADATLFGAPPVVASDHALWGVNVGWRGYRTLARGVVLAARAVYELKLGDVPFHERAQLEGLDYGEGLGGPDTVRGIARARLSGEEKMLANLEVRAILATVRPWGRPLELGVSGGGDAGRARQRGHTPLAAAGAYAGLRAIWDRAVVVRLEAAHAGQGAPAFYLAFDESF
jgi:hypothetical protein